MAGSETKRARMIAVAYSGGRDSTALLHCTLRHAAPLGLEVVALHVNHGLLPQADEWQRRIAPALCGLGAARRAAAPGVRDGSRERPARRRQHRGLGTAGALCRTAPDGTGCRLRHGAARAPSARPGRDLPAAGAARRRRGRAGGDAGGRRARCGALAATLAAPAARSDRRLPGAAPAGSCRRSEQHRSAPCAQPPADAGLAGVAGGLPAGRAGARRRRGACRRRRAMPGRTGRDRSGCMRPARRASCCSPMARAVAGARRNALRAWLHRAAWPTGTGGAGRAPDGRTDRPARDRSARRAQLGVG